MNTLNKIYQYLLQYCNIDELVFDIVIALSAYFLYGSLIPGGENLFSNFNANYLFFILLLIEFTVISYLGTLYYSYLPLIDFNAFIGFLIKSSYFIIITGLYLSMLISIPLFNIIPKNTFGKDIEFILSFALCVPFIMALLTAFPDNSKKEVGFLFYVPIFIMIPTLPIVSILIGQKFNWITGLLSFPLILFILFIPQIIYYLLRKFPLKDNLDFILLKKLFSLLIFPVLVSLALSFWHEITLQAVIQSGVNNHIKLSQNFFTASLFFSGLIPVRIIAALAPPYKLLNTLIAAAAFAYYIHQSLIEYNI